MVGTLDEHQDADGGTTVDFRGDVDGLRAIAILVIVAFHAGLPFFDGGFIGVDVFFVISGYLITRNLLRESDVRPVRFWAKRIRRLVPALGLMVVITLAASVAILPRLDISRVAEEGAASALYVSNILFARASQDYFAADVTESPFLHTWSLGVEEQFYLVWPLLFAGCALLVRTRRHIQRHALIVGFLVILVVSFVFNLRLTDVGNPWAFFSLPTRAWEFAAAGLLAAVSQSVAIRSIVLRNLVGALGLVMIGAATALLGPGTPYPGTAALIPVIGTMALIAAGEAGAGGAAVSPISAALASGPMQWIGRVSYSWYLWHWPLIILTVSALDDRVRYRVAAAAVSLPVAYVTYRWVENPLRFSARLVASNIRTYAMGAVATLVAVAVAFGVAHAPRSVSTLDARLAAATVRERGCENVKSPSGIPYCVGGDLGSETVVLFTGDSHAQVWSDAMGRAAGELGVRLATRALQGCPAIDVAVRPQRAGTTDPDACRAKREQDARLMDELRPDAVILAQFDGYLGFIEDADGQVPDERTQVDLWRDAYRGFIEDTRSTGAAVGVLRDNPALSFVPSTCIAKEQDVEACEPTRADALSNGKELRGAGRSVLDELGDVPTLELIDLICDADVCRLAINDALMYLDRDHLSHPATIELKPQARDLLAQTVGGR